MEKSRAIDRPRARAAPLMGGLDPAVPLLPPPPRHSKKALIVRTVSPAEGELLCRHLFSNPRALPRTNGCERCVARRARWVELRICCSCGHVGCCDHSRHGHAQRHFRETGHPVVRSLNSPRAWSFCYVDEVRVFV